MIDLIFSILGLLTVIMCCLIIVSILCELIDSAKTYKEIREANQKHIEWLDKQIERLENMEDDK